MIKPLFRPWDAGAPLAGPDRVSDPIRPEGARPEFRPLPPSASGGALSRCTPSGHDRGLPFEWTLNPYRGCEMACGYCYARYTHWYLGLDDPRDFERRVFYKEDLARLLSRDLDRRVAPGQRIAVGTATDPYQPLEREKEVTRSCLKIMARREGLRVSLTTKGDLVVRDLDLLRVLAQRSRLHVNFSLTTVDRRLARVLEPRAPTPQRRLAALRALTAEGIETGVFLMPVLPGLTDASGMLEEVAEAAADAGASYLVHQVVFLREPTRSFWMGVLRERFPALVARYREAFADGPYAEASLREGIARRVARARRRFRLAEGPADRAPPDRQLRLEFTG